MLRVRQGYSRIDKKMDVRNGCKKEDEHEIFEFLTSGQMTFEPDLG